MRVTAIVPVPARFAQRRDAVLAPVSGRSTLARVIRAIDESCDVVVAVAEPLVDDVRKSIAGEDVSPPPLVVAADPPGDRAQCVLAGLRELAGGKLVVVHDLGWPIVRTGVVERIVRALGKGAVAVVPARPVTDSIKAVDSSGVLTASLDRTHLRTVQYPRGFDADVLARLLADRGPAPFDELDAALSAGTPVTLVEGDDDALNVALPRDANYLAALIEGRRDLTDR